MPRSSEIPQGVEREPVGPGQESVWDYPRPPRIETVPERIRVFVSGTTVADSTGAIRVLETAGPPVYYVPADNVRRDLLEASDHTSYCEWKGTANYKSLRLGERWIPNACWQYANPSPGYEGIANHIAFYAGLVDEAWVGDERATPQPGRFYGGWVTSRIVGPFKGTPGSSDW